MRDPDPQKAGRIALKALAIRESVADSTMRQRAAALGETIRREDGVGAAVKVIGDWRMEVGG